MPLGYRKLLVAAVFDEMPGVALLDQLAVHPPDAVACMDREPIARTGGHLEILLSWSADAVPERRIVTEAMEPASPHLVVRCRSTDAQWAFDIPEGGSLTVGRDPRFAQIVIRYPALSRAHVIFRNQDGVCVVEYAGARGSIARWRGRTESLPCDPAVPTFYEW